MMNCKEISLVNNYTQCNEDGTFKTKQCNDQECRCVTKDGIPISGFKAPANESEYMNCGKLNNQFPNCFKNDNMN